MSKDKKNNKNKEVQAVTVNHDKKIEAADSAIAQIKSKC